MEELDGELSTTKVRFITYLVLIGTMSLIRHE